MEKPTQKKQTAHSSQTKQASSKHNSKSTLPHQKNIWDKVLRFMAKWLLIFFCLFTSVVIGLMVGYGLIGDGSVTDVFDWRMWRHIYNLVFG